ncbi:MAG: hypothetical protein U5J98_10900 [Halobacteriales archaeon]|nr:hypothetical protein [Halobacteriales archaeon]
MPDEPSESLYRCPICEAPAPSVGACKIHISRNNDAAHWGYVGNDLHDEIVAHQSIADRGLVGRLRYAFATSDLMTRWRRLVAGLLHR